MDGFVAIGPSKGLARTILNGGSGSFTNYAASFGAFYQGLLGDKKPKASLGGASWRGAMVGREHGYLGAQEAQGRSTVTYDFSDTTVDVELSEIVYRDTLRPRRISSQYTGSMSA